MKEMKLLETILNEGAKRSAHNSVGENPTREKTSHQLGTELDVQGGNKLYEA